jgi:hypothetical protein
VALAHAGYAPLLVSQGQRRRPTFMSKLTEGDRVHAVALAEACQKVQTEEVVRWLQQWVYDLILYKFMKTIRYNIDLQSEIGRVCERLEALPLIRYFRELMNAQGLVAHPLRPELFLEGLFIGYCRLFRSHPSCPT